MFNVEPDKDEVLQLPEDEQLPAEAALEQLLADIQAGGNASVNVYRQSSAGKAIGTALFSFQPGDYTFQQLVDYIGREYGEGEYRVQVRQDNKIVANRLLPIELPKSAKLPKRDDGELSELRRTMLEMQRENNARFERLLEKIADKPAAPAVDPMDLVARVMEIARGFAEASRPEPAPAARNGEDGIERLITYMELMDRLEARARDRLPENSGGIVEKLVDKFGPTFAQAIAAAQTQQAQRLQIPKTDTSMADRPTPPAASSGPTMPAGNVAIPAEIAATLQQFLPILEAAASVNGDPETYANMVLDFTGDDPAKLEPLRALLADAQCVDKLAALWPPIAQHREWWEHLRQALVDMLSEDHDASDTDPPEREGAATA